MSAKPAVDDAISASSACLGLPSTSARIDALDPSEPHDASSHRETSHMAPCVGATSPRSKISRSASRFSAGALEISSRAMCVVINLSCPDRIRLRTVCFATGLAAMRSWMLLSSIIRLDVMRSPCKHRSLPPRLAGRWHFRNRGLYSSAVGYVRFGPKPTESAASDAIGRSGPTALECKRMLRDMRPNQKRTDLYRSLGFLARNRFRTQSQTTSQNLHRGKQEP